MNTKIFLIIFVSAFALILLSDPIFNSLAPNGIETKATLASRDVSLQALFQFTMFLVLGFSIWPPVVKLFVFLQIKIGNAGLPLVKFLQSNERAFIYFVWGMLLIGLCIAFPGSIEEGFFD